MQSGFKIFLLLGKVFCILLIAILMSCASFAGKGSLIDEVKGLLEKGLVNNYALYSDAKIDVEFSGSTNSLLENMENQGGKITFRLDFPENKKPSSNFAVSGNIYRNAKFEKKITLQSRIKIHKNILTAARKIKRGQIFTDADIVFLNKDVISLPDSVIFDSSLILGKQARTNIPSGTILLDWMIRGVPVVKKGDIVEVSAKVKGIFAVSYAEVMEDGYLKDMIKIKNVSTKKIIEAIVVNSKKVEAP